MRSVTVIGSGRPEPQAAGLAMEFGRLAAEAGLVLICGGREGISEAACAGAAQAGGLTVGLLPGDRHDEANPYVLIELPTGMGHLRNGLVALSSPVVVAFDGQYGTVSEIALALIHRRLVLRIGAPEIEGVERVASPEEAIRRTLAAYDGPQQLE